MSARPQSERILLFDWRDGGHHPLYVRRFVHALAGLDTVIVAPTSVVSGLSSSVRTIDLGQPRPPSGGSRRQKAELAHHELGLLARFSRETRATHVVHLYADAVLPQWPRSHVRLPPTTICVFFAAAHYPRTYGTRLTRREQAREARTELALKRWRRRREAHAILALDEANAHRWTSKRIPAAWLPEPPVPDLASVADPRTGVVLYGALAPHKGFKELARALGLGPLPSYPVTVAGTRQARLLRGVQRRVRGAPTTGRQPSTAAAPPRRAAGFAYACVGKLRRAPLSPTHRNVSCPARERLSRNACCRV